MAKKIRIGLAVYALGNDYGMEITCDGCGAIIKYPQRVYSAIRYDSPLNHYCSKCIEKLKTDFQKKAKQNAFAYPTEKKLYVGNSHQCGERVENFVYHLAYFTTGRSGRLLPLRRCKKCGEFFLLLDDAKKNAKFIQKYVLVNPKTKKQICIPYIPKNMCTPFPYSNEGRAAEATPLEQWAARHPYQGGGFSGK